MNNIYSYSYKYMDVSENSGMYPQIIHFNGVLQKKKNIHFEVPIFSETPIYRYKYTIYFQNNSVGHTGDPSTGKALHAAEMTLQHSPSVAVQSPDEATINSNNWLKHPRVACSYVFLSEKKGILLWYLLDGIYWMSNFHHPGILFNDIQSRSWLDLE